MQRRDFITAGALAACGASLAGGAWAQSGYPARPVRMVVPFPPGGPTDVMGRTAAKAMGERLGQQFVVENKAGAGGNIGTDFVAKAAPDGYTIGLAAISSLAIAPHLYASLPFNVEKDLLPISLVGTTPCALVIHPGAPFSDLAGMVAHAKANPGRLSYATSGIGTSNHLAAELLQSVAGIALTNVPYKGSSQIVPDLLAGTVPMSMESSLATTLQHVRAGKLKAIAVTSPQRAKALPDVPTVAESGYPGFQALNWYSFMASGKTPAPLLERWNQEIVKVLNDPGVKDALNKHGLSPHPTTRAEFASFMKKEYDQWGAIVRERKITGQ